MMCYGLHLCLLHPFKGVSIESAFGDSTDEDMPQKSFINARIYHFLLKVPVESHSSRV